MNNIKIGNHIIGHEQPTYIIAEIGINHNGDSATAKQLIDAAVEAKVDAVKFQKRHLPSLYNEDVLENSMRYEQQFQYMIPILKEVELTESEMADLKVYCDKIGIEFLCTPFDVHSTDFIETLNVPAYKIASADLTNFELLTHVAKKKKPMIVSTGMSYWEEVEAAVMWLRQEDANFALLHCRSSYPVWPREVNLKMINRLRQFGCPVGYSGHDIGITVPLVAASMGACIIEKHLTLDKKMFGPDHKISLEPYELKRLVRDIRVADQAMGKEKRFLLRGEVLNRELFGKSLVAAKDIHKGDSITRSMVKIQGPGKGLPPYRLDELVGKQSQRDMEPDDYFFDGDIGEADWLQIDDTFRSRWGLICRFGDFEKMIAYNPKVIEFHLAEKDFEIPFQPSRKHDQELIVHTPEYLGERLMDICSGSEEIRKASVELVKRTIRLTRSLAPHFPGTPKVIAHPGAMSLSSKLPTDQLRAAMLRSIEEIDFTGIELLLENLPPYPWYFGGQWKGNYFMDADEIKDFCNTASIQICFDLSHAALYCNAKDKDLYGYVQTIMPYIRHIHFADAYGLDGEGVQVGEGDIDFDRVMPLFADYDGTWVPEVWRGHLQDGKEFLRSLDLLKRYSL
jgi:sialic acid synthase SpsE/sugar phosphate isomerase/epimerase